jgi:hypothetical protein
MINTSKEKSIVTIYNPEGGSNIKEEGTEISNDDQYPEVDASSLQPAGCNDLAIENSNADFVTDLINMLQQFTPDNGSNISTLINCNLGLLKYAAASEKKKEYMEKHHMDSNLESLTATGVLLSPADRKREYNKRYYRQVIKPRRQKELKKDANTQTESVDIISISKLNQEIQSLQLKLETKNKRIRILEEQVDSLTKLLETLCKKT